MDLAVPVQYYRTLAHALTLWNVWGMLPRDHQTPFIQWPFVQSQHLSPKPVQGFFYQSFMGAKLHRRLLMASDSIGRLGCVGPIAEEGWQKSVHNRTRSFRTALVDHNAGTRQSQPLVPINYSVLGQDLSFRPHSTFNYALVPGQLLPREIPPSVAAMVTSRLTSDRPGGTWAVVTWVLFGSLSLAK